jgi:glycosyltransferase involved in cell wall biosynthesis
VKSELGTRAGSPDRARLLIDVRPINAHVDTGLGVYSYQLGRRIAARCGEAATFIQQPGAAPLGVNAPIRLRPPDFDLDTDAKTLRTLAAAFGFTLTLSTYYPVPPSRRTPSILIVQDLIPLRLPDQYRGTPTYEMYDTHLRASCRGAAHVIAISEATRRDVIDLFGIADTRISVVYPGADHYGATAGNHPDGAIADGTRAEASAAHASTDGASADGMRGHATDRDGVPADGVPPRDVLAALAGRPFVLAASSTEPRKNLRAVLLAHGVIRERLGVDAPWLVLAGVGRGRRPEIEALVESHGGARQVLIAGRVTPAELTWLYRHARCFVFPSLYEGFGLPVVEAMRMGTPVVCSNRTSLPEVGGDAVSYADPESIDDLADTLLALITDDTLRHTQSTRGLAQARRFCWQRAADDTLQIVSDVLAVV